MDIIKGVSSVNTANSLNLYISDSGLANLDTTWRGVSEMPPYSRMYVILDGDGNVYYNNKKQILRAGFLYLFPGRLSIRYEATSRMEQLYLHLNYFNERGFDLLLNIKEPVEIKLSDEELQEAKKMFIGNLVIDGIKLKIFIERKLKDIMELSGAELKNIKYSLCTKKAIEYINKNLSASLVIEDISKNLFVSRNSLEKYFRTDVGISIGKYIDDLVLYEAEKLLLKTPLTVNEISGRLGFCDQFYFSKKFKEKFLFSPRNYRKIHN